MQKTNNGKREVTLNMPFLGMTITFHTRAYFETRKRILLNSLKQYIPPPQ
jgi:hypothetical protein